MSEFEEMNETIEIPEIDVEKYLLRVEIGRVRTELSLLDYKTNKYVEGLLTEEEWNEVKAKRQELRNQINELEEQL